MAVSLIYQHFHCAVGHRKHSASLLSIVALLTEFAMVIK